MPFEDLTDVILVSEDHDGPDDEDVGYLVMKFIQLWKLSSDESYNSQISDDLWRFACGNVSWTL